jgi:hypothetical protein
VCAQWGHDLSMGRTLEKPGPVLYSPECVEYEFSEGRIDPARLGPRSLRAAPYPAIELLQDRLSVLGALLVIANLPKLFGGKCIQMRRDLFHAQFVVALDGNWAERRPSLA